ncbi:MAG: pirin-like C-terminal cupin domain-containing protein [Bacteroidota bacterium]
MPTQYKFSDPTTHLFRGGQLGVLETNQYTATVTLGDLFGAQSSVETLSPAFYYHIQLRPNSKIEIPMDPTHNAFAYMIDEEVELAEQKKLKEHEIALFERGDTHIDLFSEKGANLERIIRSSFS